MPQKTYFSEFLKLSTFWALDSFKHQSQKFSQVFNFYAFKFLNFWGVTSKKIIFHSNKKKYGWIFLCPIYDKILEIGNIKNRSWTISYEMALSCMMTFKKCRSYLFFSDLTKFLSDHEICINKFWAKIEKKNSEKVYMLT